MTSAPTHLENDLAVHLATRRRDPDSFTDEGFWHREARAVLTWLADRGINLNTTPHADLIVDPGPLICPGTTASGAPCELLQFHDGIHKKFG